MTHHWICLPDFPAVSQALIRLPNPNSTGWATHSIPRHPTIFGSCVCGLGRGQLEGVRLLAEATVAEALGNQIGGLRLEARKTVFPLATADLDILPGYEKTHGFAFARLEQSIPGRRTAGSQFWAGFSIPISGSIRRGISRVCA